MSTASSSFWLVKSARPIFFFIIVLTLAGMYMALKVPISVFPDTKLPARRHRRR